MAEARFMLKILIADRAAFDNMRQGFQPGTDDYMVKPVNVNEMFCAVPR